MDQSHGENRLSHIIRRIMQISEGVIRLSLRLRRITPSSISIILHKMLSLIHQLLSEAGHHVFWPFFARSAVCSTLLHVNSKTSMNSLAQSVTTNFPWNLFNLAEQCFRLRYVLHSLVATTSRKRPPPVSDHFTNNRFVSQSNTVSKTLLSDIFSDCDHFMARNLTKFFCFLFPVNDHPAWSRVIEKKTIIARESKTFSF